MKKIFFLPLVALLAACSNDDSTLVQTKSTYPFSVVRVVDGTVVPETRSTISKGDLALSFSTEQDLSDFQKKIATMSESDAQQLVNNLGVKNLYNLEDNADEELEAIGEESTSIDDFNKKYKLFVEKYKGKLVRDSKHTESLSLVVPGVNNYTNTTKKALTFIANQNAQIVVGNKVRNIDVTFLEEKTPLLQSNIATVSNEAYNNAGSFTYPGKRIYYTFFYNAFGNLNFILEARKKMWYGWKADKHRNFYYISALTNIVYGGTLPPMFRAYKTNRTINTLGSPIIKKKAIAGSMYIWTDITSEKDANGNELTQDIGGVTYPLCKMKRAFIVHPAVFPPK